MTGGRRRNDASWRDPLPDAPPSTFWGSLADDDRRAVHQAGSVRPVARDEVLGRQGQRPDQVWVLFTGLVGLSCEDASGGRTVLAVRRPGDAVAERSAIDCRPLAVTCTVLAEGSALVLRATRFGRLCRERPGLGWLVLTTVLHQLRVSDAGRRRAAVRDRLVLSLLDLAGHGSSDGAVPVVVRTTQRQLAEQLAEPLLAVTRSLDELREVGAVATSRSRIRIVAPARLRALLPPELC